MSMNLYVVGFRPADAKWNQMKTIWEECTAAGIEIPKAVSSFFEDQPPGDKPGANVKIKEAVKVWSNDYAEGFEIDLDKLPTDVKILRVYLS